MNFSLDIPYPDVKVEKQDINLAKQIFNVYAGEISEDTSVHRYILEMLIFSDNEEIRKILKGIAIVEMHHLEILGELLKQLGFMPLYLSVKNNKIKWFSGKFIMPPKNLKNALLKNIQVEKKAIENYENIIMNTSDENIIHILKRIILDERLHIEIFTKIYEKIK